jgi:hypothetical protein
MTNKIPALHSKEKKMNTIGFFDFDVTTGSAIQAEELFDIFDDLASLRTSKRSLTIRPVERSNQLGNMDTKRKGDP